MKKIEVIDLLRSIALRIEESGKEEVDIVVSDHSDNWEADNILLEEHEDCFEIVIQLPEEFVVTVERDEENNRDTKDEKNFFTSGRNIALCDLDENLLESYMGESNPTEEWSQYIVTFIEEEEVFNWGQEGELVFHHKPTNEVYLVSGHTQVETSDNVVFLDKSEELYKKIEEACEE